MSSNLIILLLSNLLSIMLSFISTVVIHELGHLTGGLLSGYRLLNIKMFGLCLRINNGRKRLVLEKGGPIGQCIMFSERVERKPFGLILGGCFFNIIFGIAALFISFRNGVYLTAVLFPFGSINVSLGLTNLLSNSKCCDGRAFRECIRNVQDMMAYNNIMQIIRRLEYGFSWAQLPAYLFEHYSGDHSCSISSEIELYSFLRERELVEAESQGVSESNIRAYDEILSKKVEALMKKLKGLELYEASIGLGAFIREERLKLVTLMSEGK